MSHKHVFAAMGVVFLFIASTSSANSLPCGSFFRSERQARAQRAKDVVGRPLSDSKLHAVAQAHLVGSGERGRNGGMAQLGNYTPAQLRKKATILKRAGFSKSERRSLMEAGVVGVPGNTLLSPDDAQKFYAQSPAVAKQIEQWKRNHPQEVETAE